jgi:putative hydrolase of the HAD superfamily
MTSYILFDFFGTLVDSRPADPEVDFGPSFRLLREMGSELKYDRYLTSWSAVERRFDAQARRTGREFAMRDLVTEFLSLSLCRVPTPDETDVMLRTFRADWRTCVCYLPGLEDLLRELSTRYRLAVVSNTMDPELVPALLDAMGVRPYFDAVFLSVTVGWRKPHPEIYATVLRELGIEASDAVFVGDNYRPDYEGPTQQGIRSFLIDPEQLSKAPEHARLSSIFDLPAALAEGHR